MKAAQTTTGSLESVVVESYRTVTNWIAQNINVFIRIVVILFLAVLIVQVVTRIFSDCSDVRFEKTCIQPKLIETSACERWTA